MLKKFLIFLIVISGLGTMFLGYSLYMEYGKYLNKTDDFYKITEEEYEAKTTEAAIKLDEKLINYFSKKTFIINDGGIKLDKYIKNDKINLITFSPSKIGKEEKADIEDLDKLIGYKKKTKRKSKKKKETEKEMTSEEIEKLLSSYLTRKDTPYHTYLEQKFINFFTDEYNGDYYLNKKEVTEGIKRTNLNYINEVKKSICENISKAKEDIKDGFIANYLEKLDNKQKVINLNICNTSKYDIRAINNFTDKEELKANILFFLTNKSAFAFPGDNWTFNYGKYRDKASKFWSDINKKKSRKEIISSCFKSTIDEDIITPKVYDKDKQNFGNVKILQNYAKNKTTLFTCVLTFQNRETLKYKKEIATILQGSFEEDKKKNKDYKKDIDELKKNMGNYMINKLIINFEKQK